MLFSANTRATSLVLPRLWRQRSVLEHRVFLGRSFSSPPEVDTKKKDNDEEASPASSLVDKSLRGVGQVIFLNSTTSGAAILGGLALGDPYLAFLAATGAVSATTAAQKSGLDRSMLSDGLWGYNGCLVGCATAVFVHPIAPAIAAGSTPMIAQAALSGIGTTLLGAAATPFVAAALKPACGSVPQFTLAFNAVTLTMLLQTRPLLDSTATATDSSSTASSSATNLEAVSQIIMNAPLQGISQIFVVESCLAGAAILGGIGLYSRGLAAHALMGSSIGAATGLILGADLSSIEMGLWGFNSCLTSLGVGVFFVHSPQVVALSAGGAVASAALFGALGSVLISFGSPCLTLPFCFTMAGCYLMQGSMPGLELAQSPHSPEQNE